MSLEQLDAVAAAAAVDATEKVAAQAVADAATYLRVNALTVAALRASMVTGAAQTIGFASAGDGGEGLWRWDPTDTTSADNGGTIVVPDDAGLAAAGRWKRIYDGAVNARWFGVLPSTDNTYDCTAALQAAVDWVSSARTPGAAAHVGGELFIPDGYYRFFFTEGDSGLDTITCAANNVTIRGEGAATVLTVRQTSAKVDYFFTFAQAFRGSGGGIRDLRIDGNSDLNWVAYVDTWRNAAFTHISAKDVHGGVLDFCASNATDSGENITVDHIDYIPSSGTNSCFTQYGVRFRAGVGGRSWSECWVANSIFVCCWDTGVVLDGCHRLVVSRIGVSCNTTSTNTIDGLEHGAVRRAVEIANTVVNSQTADAGYNVVRDIYMESHVGTETVAENVAVAISLTAGHTGLNRCNIVENVAVSTNTGLGVLEVTNDSGAGQVSANRFSGNRRAYLPDSITVGVNVYDTFLDITPNAGVTPSIIDAGVRTVVAGMPVVPLAPFGAPKIGEDIWTNAVSTTPAAHLNDRGLLTPWPVYTPVTIDRLSNQVTTAGTGGGLVVLLYGSGADGLPDGQPLLASFAANPASATLQHGVLGAAVELPVGLYWVGSMLYNASVACSVRVPSPVRDVDTSGSSAALSGARSVRAFVPSSATPPATCPATNPNNTAGCAVLARRSA